jgi:hypothetical protein
MGDVIKWDLNHPRTNVGTPGRRKVVVEGVEDCPGCGAECDYEVWLENDRIVAVKPASGTYDFSATDRAYIVSRRIRMQFPNAGTVAVALTESCARSGSRRCHDARRECSGCDRPNAGRSGTNKNSKPTQIPRAGSTNSAPR